MRTIAAALTLLFLLLCRTSTAADVGYQLSIKGSPKIEAANLKFNRVRIKNRVWASPGVEEGSLWPASRTRSGMTVQRFRFEPTSGTKTHSYLDVPLQSTVAETLNCSFDEVFWPLTREMFQVRDVPMYFGGIVLAR